MGLTTPENIRTLQRKLYLKAKQEPAYRFYSLYDKVCRKDILAHAYALAKSNKGEPGVDGQSFADIEEYGFSDGSITAGSADGSTYQVTDQSGDAPTGSPGSPGTSAPTPPVALSSGNPDAPQSQNFAFDGTTTTDNGVTGTFSPSIVDPIDGGPYGPTSQPHEFSSGDSVTFTVGNLPDHVSYDVSFEGDTTGDDYTPYNFTLTGPGTTVTSQSDRDNFLFMDMPVTDLSNTPSATFTLTGTAVGDNPSSSWEISSAAISTYVGTLSFQAGFVPEGGETGLPVHFDAPDVPDPSSERINVVSSDDSFVSPVSSTIQLDADGNGTLLIRGTGDGTSPITIADSIGDRYTNNAFSEPPTVGAQGSVTQGVNSNTSGFTFSIGHLSTTDTTVRFNTAASTLPASLMPGSLASGVVTIPAGQDSVFVPVNVNDDGKIAPTRYIVVALDLPDTPQQDDPQAKLAVGNTDKPTITMNGAADNAVIPIDPQGDSGKLTDIHMTENHDGELVSTTLTWPSGAFLIWTSDQIGAPGTDLGSQRGAVDNGNGTMSYTWQGGGPTDVYGQDLTGSATPDSTTVGLSVQVMKAATPVVPLATGTASNFASGTRTDR